MAGGRDADTCPIGWENAAPADERDDMGKEVFEAFDGQQELFGYSQAVAVGDFIYVAGTLGIGEGLVNPDDMSEQMTLAYRNIAETLAHFGADMSHVVEQRVYVTDIDSAMGALEARKAAYRAGGLPASTMVEVSRLALPQAKVEISVMARKDA
jgi:enamine deaminase RidA (YjgF/YER057c/UK114 family)